MATTEQAVLVFLKLSDAGFGEYEERESVFVLEEKIQAAVKEHNAGEYDGHEFGDGWGKLYVYADDARRVAGIVLPIVRAATPAHGSYVVLRFGAPGAREERVEL